MRQPTQRSRAEGAFSLPELLLVIAVLTIISAASYPIINNFSSASAYAEAKAKAEALTAAKILFYKSDPNAEKTWNATNSDSSKFSKLKPYLYGASNDLTIPHYAADPPYDQFDFGNGIRDRVTVIEP